MTEFNAGREFSQLPDASTLTGNETLALLQDGETVRVPLADLAQWIKTAESIVPASEPFRGALMRLASAQTGVVSGDFITWTSVIYDTDNFWNSGANTRLTIPAGVTKVKLMASVRMNDSSSAGSSALSILDKNGNSVSTFNSVRNASGGANDNQIFAVTPVIEVDEDDFFEVQFSSSISALDEVQSSVGSMFAIEVVEAI